MPSFFKPSPMTSCEEPYIGDESISRPSISKKFRMTSAQVSRATRSLPTLKVIQLPSPITGRASPDDGMSRVRMACRGAAMTRELNAMPAPIAAEDRSSLRRLRCGCSCMASAPVAFGRSR